MNGFENISFLVIHIKQATGNSPALGHKGIGGKVANDKLSNSSDVHWTIETKNKHGKSFLVTYKP